jgi:hypothetical protein
MVCDMMNYVTIAEMFYSILCLELLTIFKDLFVFICCLFVFINPFTAEVAIMRLEQPYA